MPISGKLEADFSDIKREAQAAAQQLTLFEGQTNRAVDAVTKLERGGAVAISNFKTTTTATRKEVDELSATVGKTTSTFSTLATGLSTADKTLGAFGVHIGPEIHALREFGEISGKSVGELGALGTATGVTAAAFAGWNIGRKVAEVFDLDTKIASLTDRMLGLGVATQTAAAQQDSIARAIKNGADANIGYLDAVKFNIDFANKQAEAYNTSQHRLSLWQGELRKLRSEGLIEQLTADIKSHNSTVAEMASQYGISERAVEYFTRQLDAAADKARKADEATRHLLEEQKRADDELKAISDRMSGNDALVAAEKLAAAIGNVVNVQGFSRQAQEQINATMQEAIETLVRMNQATSPLMDTFIAFKLAAVDALDAATKGARELAAQVAETKRQVDEMEAAFKASGGTDLEGFRSGMVPTGRSPMQPFVGLKPSVFSAGGVAGVNTAGTYITNTFNVNGTGDDIARIVAEKLTKQSMIGGPRALGSAGP